MRTLEEIRHTPFGLLTDDEVDQLSPQTQVIARKYRESRDRELACPGHERVETATREQSNRGWHVGECKHCGKDMTYDSGD